MTDIVAQGPQLLANLPSPDRALRIPAFHVLEHFNLAETMFSFSLCGITSE
jgi:hypothetical protein